MWTKAFWKATSERMIRGAAVAVFGAFFVGDKIFNSLSVNTWSDVLSLAIGGGFGSLLLCLGGSALGDGAGPSFLGTERLKPDNPGRHEAA